MRAKCETTERRHAWIKRPFFHGASFSPCHLIGLVVTRMGEPEKVRPFHRSTHADGVFEKGLAVFEYSGDMFGQGILKFYPLAT